MSGLILLNSILDKQQEQYPDLDADKFFEIYCADNTLLNYDLSSEEIESGIVDGSRDAGIDAAYVFVNRRLLVEDFDLTEIRQPVDIELFVIQSKNQDSFKENPVDKLCASMPTLLDVGKSRTELEEAFRPQVVSVFLSFISAMQDLAVHFPSVTIQIYYCCKGDKPNSTILAKASTLETTLKSKSMYSCVSFSFLGAQELYDRSREQTPLTKELLIVGSPLSGTNSYVALCTLSSYTDFVSDEDYGLLTRIFEANVRAYQGKIEVNREIAESLDNPIEGVDFWWLNNGVTIVADKAQFMSNRLYVENPLIVNGLQTTHELHKHSKGLSTDDTRMVLVRVIVERNRSKRDEIIRATNRQTVMKPSSFKATEPIHKEIEDYLQTLDIYYDRRKNYYRREGKPTNKIVSIDRLAQAVLAVLVQKPHTARARPTTAIKNEETYQTIFSSDRNTHPLEIYGKVVQMLAGVDRHFRAIAIADNQIQRNNLRFHVLMVLAWTLNQNSKLPAKRIKQLDLSKMTEPVLQAVTDWVFAEFNGAGAEDKTAKDSSFTERLQANWDLEKTQPPI